MVVERTHNVKLEMKSYLLYIYIMNLCYNGNGGLDVRNSKTSTKYD